MSRIRFPCRFCGAVTFSPLRVCGPHRDLLALDFDAIAAELLEQFPADPLECLPMQAAQLEREDTPPRIGKAG